MEVTSLIMLADDDQDDRSFVEEALQRNNYEGTIRAVENGQELIYQLHELIAATDQQHPKLPELILLDLNMPLKDGYETMQEIKDHPLLKKIPILVLTSSSREEDEHRCKRLGCTKFYHKPLTLSEYDKLAAAILDDMKSSFASC